MNSFWKIFKKIFGVALVILGIVGLILPIIPGFIFLIPGLIILGWQSEKIRKYIKIKNS